MGTRTRSGSTGGTGGSVDFAAASIPVELMNRPLKPKTHKPVAVMPHRSQEARKAAAAAGPTDTEMESDINSPQGKTPTTKATAVNMTRTYMTGGESGSGGAAVSGSQTQDGSGSLSLTVVSGSKCVV